MVKKQMIDLCLFTVDYRGTLAQIEAFKKLGSVEEVSSQLGPFQNFLIKLKMYK